MSFSFQAAGISHACPTSSLWGGWADPSPGVWFHAVRKHLPRAAAQEGVTSISQKQSRKIDAVYQSMSLRGNHESRLDYLSCVCLAGKLMNNVTSLNARRKSGLQY